MADDRVLPAARLSGRVLVVDDEEPNVLLMSRLLTREGYQVDRASHGEAALAQIERQTPDIVLLDIRMPGLDGFEICRRIKENQATRLTPVVLVTGLHAMEDRIQGIDAGADDFLTKPVNAAELRARVRSLLRIKRYTDDLESAESVILSLALTVEARDPYTEGHCARLAGYSVGLGAALQLDRDELRTLHLGGYLHDVGKIGIPDSILLKPEALTAGEYALMKEHTTIGERLCGNLRSLRGVRSIVRHHHERLDGSGYPDGLEGNAVPLLAQIVSVADAYDAMTTSRPYRAALSAAHAYAELRRDAVQGERNPMLVESFIALGTAGQLVPAAVPVIPPGSERS